MCVNDLIVCGAKPLFFLDYYASSKLIVNEASEVIKSISNACIDSGCSLLGGETAEMPGHYVDDNFDLAEWVKAHRYRREQYQLSGSDGELNYKIPKKNFPEEIIAAVKKHSI